MKPIPDEFITVTKGMRGFFAVHVVWNSDGFWEPEQSGVGSYEEPEQAIPEAKSWAASLGITYRDHKSPPPAPEVIS